MKKLKGILLLIAVAALFQISDVDAAVATGKDSKSGLSYSVESVRVFVRNDEGLKDFVHTPDNDSKIWEQDVTGSVTMNPGGPVVYKMKNGAQLITVKLNVEGGEEKLKTVLEEKVRALKSSLKGGTDNKYFCTVSVVYKLQLPNGITHIGDNDYKNVFNKELTPSDATASNASVGLYQMLYTEIYDSSADTFAGANATMTYDSGKVATSRGLDIPLFDEYLLFDSETITLGLEKYRFMVHDIPNLEKSAYFLEDIDLSNQGDDDEESSPTEEAQNTTQTQVINNVPDTDAKMGSIVLFGSSLLLLGAGVLVWELKKTY